MSDYLTGARQTGRTTAMVKALPDGPVTILIPNSGMRAYLSQLIYDLRSKDFLDKVTIEVVQDRHDIDQLARSWHSKTIRFEVDHATLEHLSRHDRNYLFEMLEPHKPTPE